MEKLKASMLTGWNRFEIIWIFTAVTAITVISVILGDNWLGFISAIAGILCVIMAAKGKIATFYFGVIQAVTYSYITYGYALYGEAMLNAFIFLPLQFVGIYLWRKNRNKQAIAGQDIYGRKLTLKQWGMLAVSILAAAGLYSVLLTSINAAQVGLDSFAVVISIFAQILMAMRYAEQWILWIVVNVLTIALWFFTLIESGGGDWAIFAMWVAFLFNSVYGYMNWRKITRRPRNEENADNAPKAVNV